MREEGYSSGSMLLSFLLGGIVGAGLALLAAPQSGKETRQKIRDFADDIQHKGADYIHKAKEGLNTAVDDSKDFYEEKKSLVKSAIDAGKEAYEREKERLSKGHNA